MITYKPQGRLGNALFQAAACIGYCNLHGLTFSMPSKTNDQKWNPLYFPALIKRDYNLTLPQIVLRELAHNYNALPFKEKYRQWNVILEGYFQSEKYFAHCKDEVIKAFDLPYQPLYGYVGIHVRRGDYLQYPNKHILQSSEWLRNAIYYFVGCGYKSFVVCSDDIKWCKETLNPLRVGSLEFSYSENNDEIADLALLSCCEHNINSSSTFSWWASYLNQNPNKIIVTPEKWFGPGEKLSTVDIIPDQWIKM